MAVTYLEKLAIEIREAVRADALPDGDTSGLFPIYAALLLAKGEEVTSEDVHNAWVAWMVDRGEKHTSMVPFEELPPETRAEDSPFLVAIRAVARRRRER